MDFACKQFDINVIIRCGLGLTKAEHRVLEFFVKHSSKKFLTSDIADEMELNLTTVQKAVKKLYERGAIERKQKNLDNGGYVYCYRVRSKKEIRDAVKRTINKWAEKVGQGLEKW